MPQPWIGDKWANMPFAGDQWANMPFAGTQWANMPFAGTQYLNMPFAGDEAMYMPWAGDEWSLPGYGTSPYHKKRPVPTTPAPPSTTTPTPVDPATGKPPTAKIPGLLYPNQGDTRPNYEVIPVHGGGPAPTMVQHPGFTEGGSWWVPYYGGGAQSGINTDPTKGPVPGGGNQSPPPPEAQSTGTGYSMQAQIPSNLTTPQPTTTPANTPLSSLVSSYQNRIGKAKGMNQWNPAYSSFWQNISYA